MRCSTLCRCMWLDLIKNVSQMHDRNPFIKHLAEIYKSNMRISSYQFRSKTDKDRHSLEMNFRAIKLL